MAMSNPRIVFAADVTTSGVSLVRYEEGDDRPMCLYEAAPPDAGAVHNVASTLHRHQTVTGAVVENILGTEADPEPKPALVAMTKVTWNDMYKDDSAARRIALWWYIAAALIERKVPVGEVPLLTVQSWATERPTSFGQKGYKALADNVKSVFAGLPELNGGFRYTTVAVAAAAAMLVGIDTPYPVNQSRLNKLSGYPSPDAEQRNNKGLQWPAACRPPRTVDAWKILHDNGLEAVV